MKKRRWLGTTGKIIYYEDRLCVTKIAKKVPGLMAGKDKGRLPVVPVNGQSLSDEAVRGVNGNGRANYPPPSISGSETGSSSVNASSPAWLTPSHSLLPGDRFKKDEHSGIDSPSHGGEEVRDDH
jgi:hypothetical protein